MAKRNMIKTVSDQAIHLDLHAKALGIAAAENYFVNLPESAKKHLCHGSLLNLASIFVYAGLFDKAQVALKELEARNAPKDLTSF